MPRTVHIEAKEVVAGDKYVHYRHATHQDGSHQNHVVAWTGVVEKVWPVDSLIGNFAGDCVAFQIKDKKQLVLVDPAHRVEVQLAEPDSVSP